MIHIATKYLAHEEKMVMVGSKALEVEGSTLRKELITIMDKGNATKEKVKALTKELRTEKLLTVQED
nr:hypothetical protein CFP56_78272 [Quercus suber]